ncbi:Bile acid:sodium symporter [Desulfovibrio sp. X2]|uniref:bile acid:sodium symporter family protein n=1 Tax=Desulfovibrio sp. X2 TaxID=941449 RepID=UPI0003588F24|nr:bile acid:sodium symporter family protein [Desulfovibrio sp. X2]EPR37017.1 Bile acid:sodium symporter [Desulfovibrio sp. X2]
MLLRLAGAIERGFLPLAVGFSVLALVWPPLFTWIRPHIALGLGIIMFGMGLTLEFTDFLRVFRQWRMAGTGVLLQYTVMPAVAWTLCAVLKLPPETAVGVLLVGACPSGTASNVISYFAKADVALSVVMTLCSTLLAPLATPLLMELLAGQRIHVEFWHMVRSVFWIVAFPLLDGLIIRRLLRERIRPLLCIFPSISVLTISAVIACVVGLNQKTIMAFPALVMAAVILHNAAGFWLGHYGAGLLGANRRGRRTISIEVGMQNSGLAVALAGAFFGPAAALPGAIFSLWQNLAGVFLARLWARDEESSCPTGPDSAGPTGGAGPADRTATPRA